MMNFYLSPEGMGLVPILIMQLSVLGFLLLQKEKSTATWLFIGWLTNMFLLMATSFVGYTIYMPWGGFVLWIGGVVFSLLGAIFWLQFIYHFPRIIYLREVKINLIVSVIITAVIITVLLQEIIFLPTHHYYVFNAFLFNPYHATDESFFTSGNLLAIFQPLGYIWAVVIGIRETIALDERNSMKKQRSRSWINVKLIQVKQMGKSLWRPRGRDATIARNFSLLTLFAILIMATTVLEPLGLVPMGSFNFLYLLIIFAIAISYFNYSPEPTTIITRLVSISLVTLLAVIGLISRMTLETRTEFYLQMRAADMAEIKNQIKQERIEWIPHTVRYIATRTAAPNLFSVDYEVLYTRDGNIVGTDLSAEDVAMQDDTVLAFWSIRHSFPWLTTEQLTNITQDPSASVFIPEGTLSYRNTLSGSPEQHITRLSFVWENLRYEVGFDYLDFRQMLHEAAVPLMGLTVGATLAILLIFPRFFQKTLLWPLSNLLGGVSLAETGLLDQAIVPVTTSDEIGYLTNAFNHMVYTQQSLTNNLQQEILIRKQAEEKTQQLNVTLEQRVSDRTRELEALYEITAVSSQTLDISKLLAQSLTKTVTALQSNYGTIHLFAHDDASILHLVQHKQIPPHHLTQLQTLSAKHPLTQWATTEQNPFFAPDVNQIEWVSESMPPCPLLSAPIHVGQDALGLLSIVGQPESDFNLEEIALFASIADQIGNGIQMNRFRQLAQKTAVSAERDRISRDLHDSVTQDLYGLVAFTEAGQAQLEAGTTDHIGETYQRVGQTARQVLKEMRLFLHQLRPLQLEEDGLIGALHMRLAAVEGRSNIEARLLADDTIKMSLLEEEALYYIAQESLNNALRHAHATAVTIYLSREEDIIILEIIDDGCGFDPAQAHNGGMGLQNIRQRTQNIDGLCKIISSPGTGTRIRIEI